ncbi:MAG: alpha/beta hydrolase [Gammaproteobacteria bacterium]|nr:alpha/beta hydrolase [Gammaproteobacteria bacterium]
MKAKIRGTEIYFDVAGMQIAPSKGDFVERPVIFLLHGGPGGDHMGFKGHTVDLQDVAQLIFIDNRGCGRSKKTKASEYTLENNIEDIEALRKHLGLEKICVLGGSYGGMVAQGYAIRYPQHIDKLILVVTAPSYRCLEASKQYLNEHGTKQQIAICEDLWNGKMKSAAQVKKFFTVMDPLYSVTAKKKKKPAFAKLKTEWSFEALNKGFGGFLRHFDFIPHLHKITCPTLVLGAEDDWICRPQQSKIIAEHIPNAKLKIFKHCGHAIAVDAGKKYLNTIRRFLAEKPKVKRKSR